VGTSRACSRRRARRLGKHDMSLLRKALLVNGAEFVCIGLGVAQNIILTRTLGPNGIGQYAVVISTLPLAALLCCLGIPTAVLYHSKREPDRTGEYLVNALVVLSCLGLAAGGILAWMVATWRGYFGILPWFVPVVIVGYMPVALWQVLARNALLIDIQARRLSLMRLLRDVGCMGLILILLGLGVLDVSGAVVCFVAACLVPSVFGWVWVRRFVDFSARPSFSVCRKLVVMGVRLNWSEVMMVVNTQVSIFVVRYMFRGFADGFDQVGYFSRGLRISMLAVTASRAVLPLLFSRWTAFPEEHLAAHVEKVLRFVSTMALAAIVFILVAGKWLVLTMYGVEFLPAVEPMMILVPGTMLYLVSRTLMQLLTSRGLPEVSAGLLLGATIVNAALTVIMTPRMGIAGAALAATCANVLLLVLYVVTVRYKYGVRIGRCVLVNKSDVRGIIRQIKGRGSGNV